MNKKIGFKKIETLSKKTTVDDYKKKRKNEDILLLMLSPEELDFIKKAFRKSIVEDKNGFWVGFDNEKFIDTLRSNEFSEFMIGYIIGIINTTMSEQIISGLSFGQALQGVISILEQTKEGLKIIEKIIKEDNNKYSAEIAYA